MSNLVRYFRSEMVCTYVQSATQFTFVAHFNIDFLIQTQTNQIQWLFHRDNRQLYDEIQLKILLILITHIYSMVD